MIKHFFQLLVIVLLFTTSSMAFDEEVYSTSSSRRMKKPGVFSENSDVIFLSTTFIGTSVGALADWWMESGNPYFSLALTLIGGTLGSYIIERRDMVNISMDSKLR